MGVSTDAILCYGIPVEGEEPEMPWDDDHDDEDDWWEAQGTGEAMPFDLVVHCHIEVQMYILAVPGTTVRAWRGHPKQIDPLPDIDPAAVEAIQRLMAEHRIKPGGPPGWYIASMWD